MRSVRRLGPEADILIGQSVPSRRAQPVDRRRGWQRLKEDIHFVEEMRRVKELAGQYHCCSSLCLLRKRFDFEVAGNKKLRQPQAVPADRNAEARVSMLGGENRSP